MNSKHLNGALAPAMAAPLAPPGVKQMVQQAASAAPKNDAYAHRVEGRREKPAYDNHSVTRRITRHSKWTNNE